MYPPIFSEPYTEILGDSPGSTLYIDIRFVNMICWLSLFTAYDIVWGWLPNKKKELEFLSLCLGWRKYIPFDLFIILDVQ